MPLVIYTLLRLLVFGAALGLGFLTGLRGPLLVLVAVVVAFAVSYLAFARQKDAAAGWLAERSERRARRADGLSTVIDEDAAAEDGSFDAESPR